MANQRDIRRILLPVDSSDNAYRAVRYVGNMLGGAPGYTVELVSFHRQPESDIYPDERAREAYLARRIATLRSQLAKCASLLADKGFAPEAVASNLMECPREMSVAQAILELQETRGFGTIVIGRRGLTGAEESLFGSVSDKIVHYARNCAVWVVE